MREIVQIWAALIIFAVSHTALASHGAKAIAARLLGARVAEATYRLIYNALALVAVVCAAAMVWVLQNNYLIEEGVVTVEQTEIMSGPGSEFELQFEAHEGLMFQILETRPEHYLALFANQLKGWVRRTDVVTI